VTFQNGYNILVRRWTGTDRQTDRLPHLITTYQQRGERGQGRSLKDFWTASGKGRGHVGQNPASFMMTGIYCPLKDGRSHSLSARFENLKLMLIRLMRIKLPLLNPLQTKRRPLYLKTQSVPRCKHFSSGL
jgi:hypothetical protein